MRPIFTRFIASREGSAALEYGLIAAGIALGVLAAFMPFSEELQQIYASIAGAVAQISQF